MSLETILAELPELTEEDRKIIEDMICALSDDSSHETLGQPGTLPPLPPRDYWTKIFAGWEDRRYVYGVPKQW